VLVVLSAFVLGVAVILSWVYWLKGMQPGDEKKAPKGP